MEGGKEDSGNAKDPILKEVTRTKGEGVCAGGGEKGRDRTKNKPITEEAFRRVHEEPREKKVIKTKADSPKGSDFEQIGISYRISEGRINDCS